MFQKILILGLSYYYEPCLNNEYFCEYLWIWYNYNWVDNDYYHHYHHHYYNDNYHDNDIDADYNHSSRFYLSTGRHTMSSTAKSQRKLPLEKAD